VAAAGSRTPAPGDGTPRTHAEASRESRDLVSGEVRPRERLIRFAAGPDGEVTPDLAGRLPGRGLWVAADRASVEAAARKGLFSRAAKARLKADPALADLVERLLLRRLLDGLGLARRAGELVFGFEKVLSAVSGGRAAWLVEALDGSPDGRRKVLAAARKAGLGAGECDTHRLPCGAISRSLGDRRPAIGRFSPAPSRELARGALTRRAELAAVPRATTVLD